MFDWSKIIPLKLDTSNLPNNLSKLPRDQRVKFKKAKKAKRRLENRRRRSARGGRSIWGNIGRRQRELY